LQVALTLILLLLVAFSAIAVVLSGPLADEVGSVLGVKGTALTVWDLAKWPVIVLVVMTMVAILYYAAPNVRHPGFRWITPGGILAVVLWIAASAGFAFYVANFGAYNKTYGSLAGVIIFLVWVWISNVAILLGAELNAEVERRREVESGVPEEETIAVEPRVRPGRA
jgi:membrane protein